MTNKNNTTLKLITLLTLVAILLTACAPNTPPPADLTLEWKQGTIYKDFKIFSEQSASANLGLSPFLDRPQHVVLVAWLTHRAPEGVEIYSADFIITDPYGNAPGKTFGNPESVRGLFFVDVNNLKNFESKLKVKQVESTLYLIGVVFSLPCQSGLVRSLKISYTGDDFTTRWGISEREIACGNNVAQTLPSLVFAH